MAFAAELLLVFSLVLIAIGVVAALRLRRHTRRSAQIQRGPTTPTPKGAPRSGAERSRSADASPPYAPPAQAPAAPGPGGPSYGAPPPASRGPGGYPGGYADRSDDDAYAPTSTTLYPGGMDAEAAEIERLRAEIAELKAHGSREGFKRTQAMVAVAANVSGILGLLVSVAALIK